MKPHSYSMLLKSFASSADYHQQQLPEPKQLEDFLACLEDERLKIEAFKRELPLCMQLLSNALETSRQKLNAVKSSSSQAGSKPLLEEFIPLKSQTSDGETDMDSAAAKITDKSNWMLSAQLWSQAPNTDNKQYDQPNDDNMGLDINSSALTCIQKNTVRAFIPFSKDIISTTSLKTINKNENNLPEEKKLLGSDNQLISEYYPNNMISVAGGMTENEPVRASAAGCTWTTSNTIHNNNNNITNNNKTNQPHRKARRCWSPDLHRKFVNALKMLGGTQVATPKQIRELMKVDGLTNDEVKSHLQKYRLHTRRPSSSPPTQHHHHSPSGAQAAQLVVIGGIWVPPEYAAHHHHPINTAALYHQPVAGPDNPFVHHHRQQQHFFHIQEQQQMVQMQAIEVFNKNNKAPPSPDQSDARGVSESIEDGKSESGSCKCRESVERVTGSCGCGGD